ncbi:hypothetical protein J8273_0703 [Carpediemonas membranifera]|uniref:Uncharacterized protein n=1 Tax=Carpediemonas membranifera TaxID=201153 RepID=A0A8J6AZ44_9EUKA|nr:hypothetical protein J8273_0703 [Carpediemonas membranifera]|eukprot:KAG9397573.1 hypothetical protein J8273_0703 [Carpediemonas membranifera]
MADVKKPGVNFPLKDGKRPTSTVNKQVIAEAMGAMDSKAKEMVLKTSDWRHRYADQLIRMVEMGCASEKAALDQAKAGIEYMHKTFTYIKDGNEIPFDEAMIAIKDLGDYKYTGVIKGTGAPIDEYTVPYKNKKLTGEALVRQVDKWVAAGTIEPSAGEGIKAMAEKPEILANLKNRRFVLLGAGSAMGPFLTLMALGAHVVAIDIDRKPVWQRLIKVARESAGTITFPLKKPMDQLKDDDEIAENAGCDLMGATPHIANWLCSLDDSTPFTIGVYVYLDGFLHVLLSIASDAIIKAMCAKYASNPRMVSLGYLCTPTDVHVVPAEAAQESRQRYSAVTLDKVWESGIHILSGGKFLQKNTRPAVKDENGNELHIMDELSIAQGPNYALAKRLQHWRAMVARSEGHPVSSNIAPSTATVSVIHAKTFAWAYGGMPHFKPIEIFEPATSNAVMCALLLSDVMTDDTIANPERQLANPQQLFSEGAFHGGLWRTAYKLDSIAETSVLIYWMDRLKYILYAILLILIIVVKMVVLKK